MIEQGRGARIIDGRLLGIWGNKKGTLELSKSGETRKTGTWRVDTDGVGERVGIFGSRQVNGGSCSLWYRDQFIRNRIDSNLFDAAGILQLGFDGNPRFLYLCLE